MLPAQHPPNLGWTPPLPGRVPFSAAIPIASIRYGWSICTERLLPSRGGEMGVSPGAEQHLKPEPPIRDTGGTPRAGAVLRRGCTPRQPPGTPTEPNRGLPPASRSSLHAYRWGSRFFQDAESQIQSNTQNHCIICSPSRLEIAGRFLPVRAERVARTYPGPKRFL